MFNPPFRDFGLYIHWPFCVSKCPYCDFNSHVRAQIDEDLWTQSYLKELRYWADRTPGRTLKTVFFGGGTPSLMSPKTVDAILSLLAQLWSLDKTLEVTLEANPNSVELAKFTAFKAAGVNRLSLGIQSLREDALKFLGRAHGRTEALKALHMAATTFNRFSFDLIYARPHQTLQDWQEELEEALTYAGEHLSLYQLTLEPGTAFYTQAQGGRLKLPPEQLASDFYEWTQDRLSQAQRPAYEISNHAYKGAECRHNLIYWRSQDYIAIGPGAHGRLTCQGQRRAVKNWRLPEKWLQHVALQGHGIEEEEPVMLEDHLTEFLMMGLRLQEGICVTDLEQITQQPLKDTFHHGQLENLKQEGLLVQTKDRLMPTRRGMMCLNSVLQYLLKELAF